MSKAKPAPETDAPETDGAETDGAADVPTWLADPAYAGPLTITQAEQRLARHGHHVTKPAQTPDTK